MCKLRAFPESAESGPQMDEPKVNIARESKSTGQVPLKYFSKVPIHPMWGITGGRFMQVHGPGVQGAAVSAGKGRGPAAPARPSEGTLEAAAAPKKTEAASGEKLRPAHGVLRLLQEGHFKGVADVRLRINFADEISALQATASDEGIKGGEGPILDAVGGILDEFLNQDGIESETAEQMRNAASDFEEAVRNLFAGFDGAKDPKGSALVDALGTAFQNFLEAIQALIPAAPESEAAPPVDVPLASELEVLAVDATGLDFTALVENLTQSFQDAIKNLQEQFASAQVLPPLSLPSGNGGAYEKFLAILNGLNGDDASAGGPSGVDTAA